MEINIEKYLTDSQMANITEKIFIEKVTAYADRMISNVNQYGSGMFERICVKIVDSYADRISLQYEERVMQEIEKEIVRTKSFNEDYNDTFTERIRSALHSFANKVIDERRDELKPIIYERIIGACDDLLFGKIITDVFYRLNLDSAIKEVVERSKNNV